MYYETKSKTVSVHTSNLFKGVAYLWVVLKEMDAAGLSFYSSSSSSAVVITTIATEIITVAVAAMTTVVVAADKVLHKNPLRHHEGDFFKASSGLNP